MLCQYSDAFSKREQADENLYVRQKEMEKLQALRTKLDEHKKHLEELDKSVYVYFCFRLDTIHLELMLMHKWGSLGLSKWQQEKNRWPIGDGMINPLKRIT